MRRILVVLGVVILIVLSVLGVATASESYVLSEYSGAVQHGGATIVDKNYGWKSAPQNPNVVYIAVWAPEPYRDYIEKALVNVSEMHGLTAVIDLNITRHDLKGRVVLVYIPTVGREDYLISTERSVSGVLYYSYAGDAKSAVDVINNGTVWSESEIDKTAQRFCHASIVRMNELRIANQTCAVAYWWNLRAKVGKLREESPYEMIAREIASQLNQFLESD
ncbi:hypothetical protein [Thermococcus sp. MAR1]|uniref:hypothetical protein n=1 Tax=Thermococcus sp. MAR1 TaxID=1638263 RepID=UPI00143BDC1F|nr:hypothetical protein [Thermococcus sp. MAR1]NJE10100.1 hypothetical protein [Thermococcus sp. MAR1]